MDHQNADYYKHPVFHPNQLHLVTPAMKKLSQELHRWLWTGATGGVITGAARVGKTTAVRELAPKLKTRGNERIPAYYVSVPRRDQQTILSVFRQLCWSADLAVASRDRADHLSDRYVHHIADHAVEESCPFAVLIVDEMQHLWPLQFDAFAELYDKLRLLDIALTVIFVGNDQESSNLLEQVELPKYSHIRGRFFTEGVSFHGLTNKAQIQGCLAQYDALRYPLDGPTYTGFFLPDEVERGWRLESLAEDIWRVYRNEFQTIFKIESWGMQYFTATVNTLLTDFLPHHGVDLFDEEMVKECIRVSGLVPSLVRSSQ